MDRLLAKFSNYIFSTFLIVLFEFYCISLSLAISPCFVLTGQPELHSEISLENHLKLCQQIEGMDANELPVANHRRLT